ncbi:Ion transport protein-domain-containing protein [Radiomyces spectabilis]|uniref:Ion transport protein-domain-containing protein n=1 Tax=Radiomyces spectabilis TaxID=64574 RepID=UPI002220B3EF|nr:Ion transport protein-domain-containing protein [Radiomyces spectabilis]KAI8370635.1 Ion transport protein-domain-containing protein [Radiomyces spectabilis]
MPHGSSPGRDSYHSSQSGLRHRSFSIPVPRSSRSAQGSDSHSQNPPLTRERLKKKDKLDNLLHQRPALGTRRRSIANGNIFRHTYNDGKEIIPMDEPGNEILQHPLEGPAHSTASDIGTSSISVRTTSQFIHPSADNTPKSEPWPSSHPSFLSPQLSGKHGLSIHTLNPTRTDEKRPPIRRFSKLLKVSASHITQAQRTKTAELAPSLLRSAWNRTLHTLMVMAARVVDARSPEPVATRMSVDEITALARYLQAIQTRAILAHQGPDPPDRQPTAAHGTSSPIPKTRNMTGPTVQDDYRHLSKVPSLSSNSETMSYTERTHPPHHSQHRSVSSSFSLGPPVKDQGTAYDSASPLHFSSLPNPETQSVLFPSEDRHVNNIKSLSGVPSLLSALHRLAHHIQTLFRWPSETPAQDPNHHRITPQLQGWSLFAFKPDNPLRLTLWKLLASRWFNLCIFILLVAQWLILATVPIRTSADKVGFSRASQYALLGIHVIYTCEAVAKIIVYGLLLSSHSTSRPTFRSVLTRFRAFFRRQKKDPSAETDDSEGHNDVRGVPRVNRFSTHADGTRSPVHYSPDRFRRHESFEEFDLENSPNHSSAHASNHYRSFSKSPSWSVGDSSSQPSVWYSGPPSPLNASHPSEFRKPRPSLPAISAQELDYLTIYHGAYLGSLANILDIIAITGFWVDVFTMFTTHTPWSLFQALSAARVLRFLPITAGTEVIMQSLRSSVDMLWNILGFFTFFWLLFSLLGLFVFMNAFSRQCALMPEEGLHQGMTDIVYVKPERLCSGYFNASGYRTDVFDLRTGEYVNTQSNDGYICQIGQVCIQDLQNEPAWGYVSFQNIFYTLLNVFTVVSTEGWTDMMYQSQGSISMAAATVYYCACIYLMTFIMIPMFIAVITTSFALASGNMRAFSVDKKPRLLIVSHLLKDYDDQENEEWIFETQARTGQRVDQDKMHCWRRWAYVLVKKPWFPYLGSIVVAADIIVMCFYSASLDVESERVLVNLNRAFTFLFAVEIFIRLAGAKTWNYFWSSYRNRADFIIAIITLVIELAFVKHGQAYRYLTLFSILRSYRLIFLLPRVLSLLSDVIGDGQGVLNLTLFTFLVLFLFSPIAVQLFGGDYDPSEDDEMPFMRFDNFYQAFLALFQIMTGENWTDILFRSMHSQRNSSAVYAALFMILIYFVVHYIVLNLFIAVIMENFNLDEDEIRQIQIKKYIRQHRWQPEYFQLDRIARQVYLLLPLFMKQDEKKLQLKSIPSHLTATVTHATFKDFMNNMYSFSDHTQPSASSKEPIPNRDTPKKRRFFSTGFSTVGQLEGMANLIRPEGKSEETLVKYGDEYERSVAQENKDVVLENLRRFRTLVILKPNHWLRRYSVMIINNHIYRWLLLGMLCTSVILGLFFSQGEWHHGPADARQRIEYMQIVFLGISFLDVGLHIVANGLIVLPESYLRSLWNILDVALLISQLIVLCSFHGMQRSSWLRILRVWRIVRIVYFIRGMRIIFLDLMHGLPKMIDALILNLLVFVPFAIYGCFIFHSRFRFCNDMMIPGAKMCLGEYAAQDEDNVDILIPRVWQNPYQYSFDDFKSSLLHLFECATGEGWIVSLFSAMSVVPVAGQQPRFHWTGISIWHSTYYVLFMFVASLCSIQLFIGVLLEMFKQRSGISSLTGAQRKFRDLQRQLALINPSRKVNKPTNPIRLLCYKLTTGKTGKRFSHFMTAMLVANIGKRNKVHFR